MGFKEKMAEHKERQEALQYFRANNDALCHQQNIF